MKKWSELERQGEGTWIDLADAVKRLSESGVQVLDYDKLLAWCDERGVLIEKQGDRNLVRQDELANALYHSTTKQLIELTKESETKK